MKRLSFKSVSVALTLACAGLWGHSASAAPLDWTEDLGGIFSKPANWSPLGPPAPADNALFDLSGAYTVSFSANRTNSRLLIGNDKVAFDLGDSSSHFNYRLKSLTLPSITLGLGTGDVSRANLLDGELRGVSATIGYAKHSDGNLTVNAGANLLLPAVRNQRTGDFLKKTGILNVGGSGTGGLTIISGGHVSSNLGIVGTKAGSHGNATLSGPGSSWTIDTDLRVGGNTTGRGVLKVSSGALLDVNNTLEIRKRGTVTLNGGTLSAGSINKTGLFNFLAGTLNITKSDFELGLPGPLGSGLRLQFNQALNVTEDSTLDAGAVLTLDDGKFHADHTNNLGQIVLGGASAQFSGTSLINRGSISGTGSIVASFDNRAGASVALIDGDHLTVSGDTTNNGAIHIASGAVADFNSFTHNGGDFSVASGGTANFAGPVHGHGNFAGGGTFSFLGHYGPGDSPSHVNIDGDVAFGSAGALDLELASTGSDQLGVTKTLDLHDVNITLADGFTPQIGDTFTLVTANDILYNGQIHVPSLGSAIAFKVDQGTTSLSLTVIPEPHLFLLPLSTMALQVLSRRRKK